MNHILPKIKRNILSSDMESQKVKSLIRKLSITHQLHESEYLYILDHISTNETEYLFHKAYEAKVPYYQNRVFLRGLIEISNYCKMGCKYCGINHTNKSVQRYRLTKEEILSCVDRGYSLGYRTFVLQGGEDAFFTDEYLTEIIQEIKSKYPNTRITLSVGERSYDSYKKLKESGADRYLLRHETASRRLYEYLHPDFMSFDNRRKCLQELKAIGFQTGAGFMVGSPTQTNEDLVQDLVYLKGLKPHMVGIGPYICHSNTELQGNESGTVLETLIMVALVRLILPKAMLPATTALGTLEQYGREKALEVGANVMMPNISPNQTKKLYEIYQNKVKSKDTDEQDRDDTEARVNKFHHVVDFSVGDYAGMKGMKQDV